MTNGCHHRSVGAHCDRCSVRHLSVCAALADQELSDLERIARPFALSPRETLFRQGDPVGCVFNVTGGALRLCRGLRNGGRQIVGFVLPGDFLGLGDQETYAFSAEAIGAVTVCRFHRSDHGALVDAKPHLLRRLHDVATHDLASAQEQIVLIGRTTAEQRVAAFLLGLRRRWTVLNDGRESATVPLPMGRQDIADYLGLTIETVSRMMTRLARGRMLTIVPDGIRILDAARLERIASS